MKSMKSIVLAVCIASFPIGASALDVGESDFVWVSDLAIADFSPLP